MKTINQIPSIAKQVDSNFPHGAIVNETDTSDGTPVIREIYNDILTNIYKLLDVTGITPNNLEDNTINGHQILNALKKLPNNINDIEQVLTLSSGVWTVPLNTSLLPNKYFFLARATDNYTNLTPYTFEGSNEVSYPFASSGFNASDELLVIIDVLGVRAYSLTLLTTIPVVNEIFTVMGTPLSFNDTSTLYYQEDGGLLTDLPSLANLESIIRVDLSDGTIIVSDMVVLNGYVLCFCLVPSTNQYFFRQFILSNLTVSQSVALSGASFDLTTDNSPYIYAESGFIYVTNNMNLSANDYQFTKLVYTPLTNLLTFSMSLSLDSSFLKTSNAVVKTGFLFTFISGVLDKFNLTTGVKTNVNTFNGLIGNLFVFNGNVYFGSGDVAKKWTI